jgi:hypothetical protein
MASTVLDIGGKKCRWAEILSPILTIGNNFEESGFPRPRNGLGNVTISVGLR